MGAVYYHQVTWRRTLGLSEHEIRAIQEVGIGADELNELLLEAIRCTEQGGRSRAADL
jgi:hypothetical protein